MAISPMQMATRRREAQSTFWKWGKTSQMKRNRVAYHVSRGRTVEDIAIRERMPTSLVRSLMPTV